METEVVQVDPGSPRRKEEKPDRNQAQIPAPPAPLWLIPLVLWGPPARLAEVPAPAQAVADKEVTIQNGDDVILARQSARETARELGFSAMDQTRIATATAELSRNVYQYAGKGTVTIHPIMLDGAKGLEIIFEDQGPGIPNLDRILEDGLSPENQRGQGLSGSRRLVDEFTVDSQMGVGTRITIRKWLTRKNKVPSPPPSPDLLSV